MTELTLKISTEKYMYQKMRIYNIRIYFIKSIELFTISLFEYSISNMYEKLWYWLFYSTEKKKMHY